MFEEEIKICEQRYKGKNNFYFTFYAFIFTSKPVIDAVNLLNLMTGICHVNSIILISTQSSFN